MLSARHLALFVVALLCLLSDNRAHAGLSVGLSLAYPILESGNQEPLPIADAIPSSIVELHLSLTGANLSTPVSSFAFSFNYPDLSNPSFESQLPPGWTYTLGSNFFSAENESGTNISSSHFESYLGIFFFTINSNVPIGTSFDLGQTNLTNIASGGAGGAPLHADFSTVTLVRVNVVPEPPAFWLLTSALLAYGLGVVGARLSQKRLA